MFCVYYKTYWKGIYIMKKHWLLSLLAVLLIAALTFSMVACDGGETPDTGNENPDGGNENPDDGNENPDGGNENPDGGNEGGYVEPTNHDFTYTLSGSTYIITGVKEGVSEPLIPKTYQSVAITGIDAKALAGNTVTAFKLEAEEPNENFEVTDGILYAKGGKTLLAYPGGKTATTLTVNKNVTKIGAGAFAGNAVLTEIDINKATEIGDEAFKNAANIASFKSSALIAKCGKDAFAGTAFYENADNWENGMLLLKGASYQMAARYLLIASDPTLSGEITLNKNLWCIADYAFNGNTAITSVKADKSLYSIGAYAFAGCTEMKSFNWGTYQPDELGAAYFGEGAFKDCIALTIFVVPVDLTTIYAYTFAGCTSMHYLVIEPNKNTIDSRALTGTPITDVYYYALSTQTTEVDPIKSSVPELNLTAKHEWFYDEKGTVNDQHKYWRFVDGIPTLWEKYNTPVEW